jgi:acetylornithine deacetylase/succinyl-diaminopimelate desuccinylase-like protein
MRFPGSARLWRAKVGETPARPGQTQTKTALGADRINLANCQNGSTEECSKASSNAGNTHIPANTAGSVNDLCRFISRPLRQTNKARAAPTFEVHGLVGGYTGPGSKTIIPPRAEAKISMRLVPDMDADKIFRLVSEFIKSKNKDVEIHREGTLRPYLGQFTGPYAEAATRAMKYAFGKEPAFTREGGSIDAVVTMEKYLKVPIVFLGLSLPEHGYHAPNENYDWIQASGGMKMFVRYFAECAELK